MAQRVIGTPLPVNLPDAAPAADTASRWVLPAWVISAIVHAILLVAAALLFRYSALAQSQPKGQPGEAVRAYEGRVVVKRVTEEGEFYDENPRAADAQGSGGLPAAEVFSDQPPVPVGQGLQNLEVLGPDGLESLGGGAAGLLGGPRGSAAAVGQGQVTRFFGVEGQGTSFVYVIDRSASMGSMGSLPLNLARNEIRASLNQLTDQNTFHIIFYNDAPQLIEVFGNRLAWANEANKVLASRHMAAITPTGATRHREALLMAVALRPDVIYFLTDGDVPSLSDAELAEIARRNAGAASIHAIQFGAGPRPLHDNFLMKLARQNNGSYQYVNVRDYAQ
jgi:hypothetical protein